MLLGVRDESGPGYGRETPDSLLRIRAGHGLKPMESSPTDQIAELER